MTLEDYGLDLSVLGSIVACIGVYYNNILLDHTGAMLIWMFSNIVLLVWALGLYRKWWDGGLSGLALFVMYLIFSVTNIIGLAQVGAI